MKEKISAVITALADLQQAVGFNTVQASVSPAPGAYREIIFHGVANVDAAMELLKGMGIGKRSKNIITDVDPWTSVEGALGDIRIKCFCKGLPHTCHKETVIEKIPKCKTVDTGEFIEVSRTRVVCTDVDGKEQL